MTHYRPQVPVNVGDRITFDGVTVEIERQSLLEHDRFHVVILDPTRDVPHNDIWHLDEFVKQAARAESVGIEYAERNVRTPEMNP